jgi:hypothetical protein
MIVSLNKSAQRRPGLLDRRGGNRFDNDHHES